MTTNAKKTKSKRSHNKPNKLNNKVDLKRIQKNAEILKKAAVEDK
jgi:hypothetical protein